MAQYIYMTLEDPSYSRTARFFSIFMMAIILLSTACFIFESEVETEIEKTTSVYNTTGMLNFYPFADIFYYAEWISVSIFTLEYLMRFATCKRKISFFFSPMNMIDLCAWLPFWITGSSQSPSFPPPEPDSSEVGNAGFIRAVRLIRVFRIFKVGKYSLGIQLFGGALKSSAQSMSILVLVLSVTVVLFSSVIWLIERPNSSLVTDEMLDATGMRDMQSVCFGTIPSTMWWSLTTMTTVGYGDCYPITFPGKATAIFAMILGIVVLALPITVLGSNFQKMVEMYDDDAAEFTMQDISGDGHIDELELREFLIRMKKNGSLRPGADINVLTLMDMYDEDGAGKLTLQQFKRLQQDVVQRIPYDHEREMAKMKEALDRHEEQMESMHRKLDHLTSLVEQQLSK